MLNKAYPPHLGGVETVLSQLANGLHAVGHEVSVLCFGEREVIEELDGIKIFRVPPLLRVGSAPLGWGYYREYRRLSAWADAVHFHSPNPMGELSYLLAPKPKHTIVTYHGDAVRPRVLLACYDAVMRLFLNRCSVVCVTSPKLALNSRVLSRLRRKIDVIPIGIDLKRFTNQSPETGRAAQKLVAGLGEFTLLFAGRLVYYKGLEVLLNAIAELNCETAISVGALIVGAGPLEQELKDIIERRGLREHVRLIPPQPDDIYTALFRCADCFVLPSLYPVEAFGISMLEAMASGLPSVSTELGTGTSWLNQDGVTGLVVPPGNVQAMANAIRHLRDHPMERLCMGNAARQRAAELFDERAMLEGYSNIIADFEDC